MNNRKQNESYTIYKNTFILKDESGFQSIRHHFMLGLKKRNSKQIIFLLIALLIMAIGFPSRAEILPGETVQGSSLTEIPQYNGFDYVVINDNQPDFYIWQITDASYVHFSSFDTLGRTGPGMACLGPETLPTEPRGEIGNIQPSGWHTVRYDNLIEDRYLYNRAHVIGYLLCGDNATPENLFTGTRYLNAGSMLQFETIVANYIEATHNHVIYRCTPMYEGDNLVASGVQMEAYSVEDRGVLSFNVFAFNIQPGIIIEYATGDSREEDRAEVKDRSVPDETTQKDVPKETEKPEANYVLNKNTKKFHYPDCSSVSTIKEKNRLDFYGTRDEVIAMGYSPCGRCHP